MWNQKWDEQDQDYKEDYKEDPFFRVYAIRDDIFKKNTIP